MRIWMQEGTRPLLSRIGVRLQDTLQGRRSPRDLLTQGERERPVTVDLEDQYREWLAQHLMTPERKARIRSDITGFAYTPLINLIMIVAGPADDLPRRALESVQAQLYNRWQLCIAVEASHAPRTSALLEEWAAADRRVRIARPHAGAGPAAAYNDALAIADGEFMALLHPQDTVAPHALYEVVRRLNSNPSVDLLYSDEDRLDPQGRRGAPFFKPDWSPDLLLSADYLCRLCVIRRSMVAGAGGFRPGYGGSEVYDLVLRVTEQTSRIVHIPDVLYSRATVPAQAPKGTAGPASNRATLDVLQEALERRGTPGEVRTVLPDRHTRRLRVTSRARVSIIIPTRDRASLLRRCVTSIKRVTAYPDVEFIVVDNGTRELQALAYLSRLARDHTVLRDPGEFNYSRLCNGGARSATGQLLLFVNNDVEALHPDWLTALVEHALRPGVGAVGCRLVFPNGRIQHAGVVVGLGGTAGHPFHGMPPETPGYMGFDRIIRNCSAVTGACMMTRREVFHEAGGFDERYRIVLSDVDFCLRLRERGYLVVYTPEATLIHHESATRGPGGPAEDIQTFRARWKDLLVDGDPYYHPELSLTDYGYTLKT